MTVRDFEAIWKTLRVFWATFCGVASVVGFLEVLRAKSGTAELSLSLHERLGLVTMLGVLMAVVHAVAWSLTEKVTGWRFGAGADPALPRGLAAVTLSLTVIFPLLFVPPMYAWLFGIAFVPEGHYLATALAAIGTALGHLAIYGSNRPAIAGLRSRILATGDGHELFKETAVLLVYAYLVLVPIVAPYRIATQGWATLGTGAFWRSALIPPAVVFLGGMAFILVRYPDSIEERSWLQVRGVVVGFLVMAMVSAAIFF